MFCSYTLKIPVWRQTCQGAVQPYTIRTTALICNSNKSVSNELHSGKKIGGGKQNMFQMFPNFAEQLFVAAK